LDATSPRPERGRPRKTPGHNAPGLTGKPRTADADLKGENPGQWTPGSPENPGQPTTKPRTADADDFTTTSLKDSHSAKKAADEVREVFDEYVTTANRCQPRRLPIPDSPDPWDSNIKARLKEHGLTGWRQALVNVERSEFHCGGGPNGWRADLDWLCKPKNFAKMLAANSGGNGKKGNGHAATAPQPGASRRISVILRRPGE
jgi:hypothetical protein